MAKQAITYEVVSLPTNRERLSPQLLKLVESIEFLKEEIDGKLVVDRDQLYKLWLSEIDLTTNDKVFASYIHQLIQFAFLDRMNVKPPKVQTVEELKAMIAKQMKMLEQAEKDQLLTEAINEQNAGKLKFKLDVREAEEVIANG